MVASQMKKKGWRSEGIKQYKILTSTITKKEALKLYVKEG